MNHGPVIFLAAFLALAASWFGFVLMPDIQVGGLQQTNMVGVAATYPVERPGLAREGLDVYRANGCAACHSQQVQQSGTVCDVVMTDAGTNRVAVIDVLTQALPDASQAEIQQMLVGLPKKVLKGSDRPKANRLVRALKSSGAKSSLSIVPVGADIARGWGKRQTVAQDFLFDSPVMLGSQRIGPDLANVGLREPDARWQYLHLYAPRLEVKGSIMPPFRYLFEERRIRQAPSPDALPLPPDLAPPQGYAVVPARHAQGLVAYMLSLVATAPLFNAPLTVPPSAEPAAQTNAPSKNP